ncbi:hypothetical protein Aperf_G00000010092 [Anoplocephala perfoliata]
MHAYLFFFSTFLSLTSSEFNCDLCRSVLEHYRTSLSEIDPNVSLGGGNTDWEEKFIGKYAFSELHALETLENTLKKLDDRQAHFLSDIESELEDFWSEHLKTGKTGLSEIVEIFCNEKLKYCCPWNTFGADCSRCSPCNVENGYCDGNGTRSGDGHCVCRKGFSGKTCDECDLLTHFQSFFENGSINCVPCHSSCSGGCSDGTSSSCFSCAPGYLLVKESGKNLCQDIDECENSPCKKGTYCINNAGSFFCAKCPNECSSCKGPSECLDCSSGFELEGGKCVDIDECLDLGTCSGPNERCVNRFGSYRCICKEGYRREQDICVPAPRRSSRPAYTGRWTSLRTKRLLTEFGKLMAFLVCFGVIIYFISNNLILSTSLAVIAVAFIYYQADILDSI